MKFGLTPYSFPSATNKRTLKISFSVKGSIADTGTVITAIVSPSAFLFTKYSLQLTKKSVLVSVHNNYKKWLRSVLICQ